MILILPLLAAIAASLAFTPIIRGIARSAGLIAKPTQDRWHEKPTALLGGAAVYGGFLVGLGVALFGPTNGWLQLSSEFGHQALGILLGSSLMFFVGLIDDRLRMRPSTKLIFQGLAASIVISFGVIYPVTSWTVVNVLVTFFWFLALTNALNLLDNMDGVAVGIAVIAALFLAGTFYLEGAAILSSVCLALAGAALGFLPYNFHKASIFMGDSGSLFIGALLASLGAAYPGTASPSILAVLFVPAAIVIIPILDTLLVTVSRTLAGRPISLGGRDHTTHRLVAMGLSEPQVALLLYGFAAIGGVLAMILRWGPEGIGSSIGAVFLVGLLILAGYLGRMHTYAPSDRPSGRVTLLVSDLLYKRRAFEVVLDLILFTVAYQLAYLLRWDGQPPAEQLALFDSTIALAVVAKSAAFGIFGVYRGTWHQISLPDVHRITRGTLLGVLMTVGIVFFFYPSGFFSRSTFILDGILVGLLAIGARVSFKSLDIVRHSLDHVGVPTLLYGAGRAGELVIREMISNSELAFRPVGFIDDNPAKRDRLIQGYPVLGGVDKLELLVEQYRIRRVVLCTKTLDDKNIERVRDFCRTAGMELQQVYLDFRPMLVEPIEGLSVVDSSEANITSGIAHPSVRRRRHERTA